MSFWKNETLLYCNTFLKKFNGLKKVQLGQHLILKTLIQKFKAPQNFQLPKWKNWLGNVKASSFAPSHNCVEFKGVLIFTSNSFPLSCPSFDHEAKARVAT